MKRILTAFLCACMIAVSATGCGYTDALDKSSSNTETTQATEVSAEDEIKDADYSNHFFFIVLFFIFYNLCKKRVIWEK